MSDSESDTEIQEAVNVKMTLNDKSVVKPRKPISNERMEQLAQMRERAKIVAQAKRELRESNPDVKEYNKRDPKLIEKVAEIEKRATKPAKPAKPAPVSYSGEKTKVTKAEPEPVLARTESVNEVVKPAKKPKNKRIVYVSESDSSIEEEEVVIKQPRAKKTYQWTP